MLENEKTWRSEQDIREQLLHIWETMRDSVDKGCRTEGVLRLKIVVPGQDDLESPLDRGICESMVAAHFDLKDEGQPADKWLGECARWAWRIKIAMQLESELNMRLREAAEQLHDELEAAGFSVLLDDRKERPGVMFADMELVGIPHRLVLGERGLDAGSIEYKGRQDADKQDVELATVITFLKEKSV